MTTQRAWFFFAKAAVVTLALLLSSPSTYAKEVAKLEVLNVGPLRLLRLVNAKRTILDQEQQFNQTIYRRFEITADAGEFEYLSQDGGKVVLSGALHSLKVQGLLHRSGPDDVDSMVVESKDRLSFILTLTKYILPSYAGGQIVLKQKDVWVGNLAQVDLLKNKGTIYFRSAGVDWNGMKINTDFPKMTWKTDLQSSNPTEGVTFNFDLASSELSLRSGSFRSTQISQDLTQSGVENPEQKTLLKSVSGALAVALNDGIPKLTAKQLDIDLISGLLSSPRSDDAKNERRAVTVVQGLLHLDGLTGVTTWAQEALSFNNLRAAASTYSPSTGATDRASAWKLPDLAGLLKELRVASPDEIRQASLTETASQLKDVGENLLFVSIKRSLLERLLQKNVADIKAIKNPRIYFGIQSIGIAANISTEIPGIKVPLSIPVDVEVSPSVDQDHLVLRPVMRFLMLGKFNLPSSFRVEDILSLLRDKIGSLSEAKDAGFVEVVLPIDLTPKIPVDLSTMSDGNLKVSNGKYTVPVEFKPSILLNPDSLWLLIDARFKK